MRYKLATVFVGGTLALGACSIEGPDQEITAPSTSSTTSASSTTSSSSKVALAPTPEVVKCHAHGVNNNWLPDKKCTPGHVNQHVRQSNIKKTICVGGWSTKQRKLTSENWYAEHKRKSMAEYGYYGGQSPAFYEYDHLVPISLGGATQDERNLWAEWDGSPNPKDAVEAAVYAAVCANPPRMTLAAARKGFETDWTKIKVPPKPKTAKKAALHHVTSPASKSAFYANCTAVRAAGAAPLYRGHPGYSSKLDRDGDGVACES